MCTPTEMDTESLNSRILANLNCKWAYHPPNKMKIEMETHVRAF